MTTPSDHQAAAALLNQAIHAVNDLWLEADGDDKPFLDEAISKLHEAQSLMMKARLRVETD
jgi:hypothetical protein